LFLFILTLAVTGQPLRAQSGLDQTARFLAGLPVAEDSALARLQETAEGRQHMAEYAGTWTRFDELYFSKMRAWSRAELSSRLGAMDVVYYLFSGPDLLNPIALFPDTRTYILAGLESPGSLPPPEGMDRARLADSLATLRAATDVILSFSFFITKDMKNDLERSEFRGVLPIMLTFIALSGGQVNSVDFVALATDGRLVGAKEGAASVPGVRIIFQSGPGAPPKTAFYFQCNLANDAAKKNSALFRFMESYPGAVSYLKAASYLMHETYFSNVRDFLLSHSRAILQDDSGIPFHYFRDGLWHLTFFGSFTAPLDIFKKYDQAEYREAFALRDAVAPLPFGTGYKWRHGESNLMLAVKGEAPRAVPASGN